MKQVSTGRRLVSVGLIGVSLVLLVVSYVAPWYHLVTTVNDEPIDEAFVCEDRFYLDCWTREISSPPWTSTSDYDGDSDSWQAVGDVMTIELVLLSVAAVLTMAACALMASRRRPSRTIVCGAAAVATAAAALFFFLMLSSAIAESALWLLPDVETQVFWGDYERLAMTTRWEPMIGWYLVVAATLLQLVAAVLISSGRVKGSEIY